MFGDAKREIRFVRPLGKGGFGSVYLADVVSEEGLIQRLAVKTLHDERGHVPEIAARARDEARLLSQVNHDNVVKVFGLTEVGGRVAVLMEYVEGVDCAALLYANRRQRGGGLPPRVAAQICERAASALHTAWSGLSPETGQPLHIVHRDIKPTNILLSRSGAVKVMDFGVARGEIGREAVTAAWEYGTRRYMAPERILDGESGSRTDVYALGATFLELVTGVRFEALPVRRVDFRGALAERIEDVRVLEEDWGVTGVSSALGHLLAYAPEDRLPAREAERLFASWADALPGPELRRYAAEVMPAVLEKRMQRLAEDDELLSVMHEFSGLEGESGLKHREESPPRRVQPRGWASGVTQVLGVLIGLGLVFYGLQFRSADIAGRMSSGEAPAELAPVEAPPVTEVLPQPVQPSKPVPSTPASPVSRSAEKGASVEPPEAPIPVMEWVSLKILADPREGGLKDGSRMVEVGNRIEMAVGEHRFEFRGQEWEVDCVATLTSASTRIKFIKETGQCEVR